MTSALKAKIAALKFCAVATEHPGGRDDFRRTYQTLTDLKYPPIDENLPHDEMILAYEKRIADLQTECDAKLLAGEKNEVAEIRGAIHLFSIGLKRLKDKTK